MSKESKSSRQYLAASGPSVMTAVAIAPGRCQIRSALTANKMTVLFSPDQSEAYGPDRDPGGQESGLDVGSK